MVSATVLKRASVKVLAQPTFIEITADDISRGYVDIPPVTRLDVQSNSLDGYTLDFTHEGEFARQIVVIGLGTEVQLGVGGGRVTQPAAGIGVTRKILALGFRFVLANGARQGAYPWPVRVSVAPL